MKRYVLSEKSARRLRGIFNSSGSDGGRSSSGMFATPREMPAPFEVMWAAAADGGAWLVYLPEGAWRGFDADPDWDDAGYPFPTGWYFLPDSVADEIDEDGDTQLWASVQNGYIAISVLETLNAVHICDIHCDETTGEKFVKQIVRSVITDTNPQTPCNFDLQVIVESRTSESTTEYRRLLQIFGDWKVIWNHVGSSRHYGSAFTPDPGPLSPGWNTFDIGSWQNSPSFGNVAVWLKVDMVFVHGVGKYEHAFVENGFNATLVDAEGDDRLSPWSENNEGHYRGYYKIGQINDSAVSAQCISGDIVLTEFNIFTPGWNEGGGGDDGGVPKPFDIEMNELTQLYSCVRPMFWFDGQMVTVPAASIGAVPSTGSYYLVGVQSGTDCDDAWSWSTTDTPPSQSASRALVWKLYDFSGGEITCDYRNTFLDLSSPHLYTKFEVRDPLGQQTDGLIVQSVSSDEAKLEMSSDESLTNGRIALQSSDGSSMLTMSEGNQTVVDMSSADLQQGPVAFHTLTVHHAGGNTTDEYDVLSNSDIDVYEGGANIDVITGISFAISSGYLVATLTKKNLQTGTISTEDVNVASTVAHTTEN